MDKIVINSGFNSGTIVGINNGKIVMDDKIVQDYNGDVKVIIKGDVKEINCDGSVKIYGSVEKANCGGSCKVNGNVTGNINAGGSVIYTKKGGLL